MVELRHVRGHQGIMGNEVADRLADMGKSEYGEREVTAMARELALEVAPKVGRQPPEDAPTNETQKDPHTPHTNTKPPPTHNRRYINHRTKHPLEFRDMG